MRLKVLLYSAIDLDLDFFEQPFSDFLLAGINDMITCVRWTPNGEMLGITTYGGSSKIVDIKTEKTIFSGTTSDKSKLSKNVLF